jgi:uncharacterized membrane protein YhaH (DUF805 family)
MNWYLDAFRNYAKFDGRSRRRAYWLFMLFNIIALWILLAVDLFTGTFSAETGVGLLSGIYCVAVLVPSLALSVRRLHDIGKSGWWVLIGLVPIIGGLVLLYFAVLDSQPGDNVYGPNPKGVGAAVAAAPAPA